MKTTLKNAALFLIVFFLTNSRLWAQPGNPWGDPDTPPEPAAPIDDYLALFFAVAVALGMWFVYQKNRKVVKN